MGISVFPAGSSSANVNYNAGNTASRPGSPVAGNTRFNTTLNALETYDGTTWRLLTATGLLPSDTFILDEVVIIAGGGGGGGNTGSGSRGCGGGGAGGYRSFTNLGVYPGIPFTITVGGGGGAGSPGTASTNGVSSSLNNTVFNYVSTGGGAGGSWSGYAQPITGSAGGSGGGAGEGNTAAGGAGNLGGFTPSEGFRGGNNPTSGGGPGSGGGGSSAQGSDTPTAGGTGTASAITGSVVTRAAGGTGGGISVANGTAGTANTGNGGTGASGGPGWNGSTSGGVGGSGVVIIAYPTSKAAFSSISAGLTYTLSTNSSRAGFRVYTFTAGTGTVTL